jgi:hypothetical protein
MVGGSAITEVQEPVVSVLARSVRDLQSVLVHESAVRLVQLYANDAAIERLQTRAGVRVDGHDASARDIHLGPDPQSAPTQLLQRGMELRPVFGRAEYRGAARHLAQCAAILTRVERVFGYGLSRNYWMHATPRFLVARA